VRREPLRKWVLDPPVPLPDELAEPLRVSRPRRDGGRLDERKTPLAAAMVDGVPADGRWYLTAVCYSSGEATALASGISRGQYGYGLDVARGLWGDKNSRGSSREHFAVLLRRRVKRPTKS
jgi:hypothetical protein